MNRQEYNRKILDFLIKKECIWEDSGIYDKLKECIEIFPQQRFGQIVCNYICGDYRDKIISDFTKEFMNIIFPDNPDPFFEESHYTYYRLTREIPENLKKELDEKKGKRVYYKLDNGSTGTGILSGVCINPWSDEWNWKIEDKKLISTNIHLKLL